MRRVLIILALAVPALAQEPSRKIAPADPVSITARQPITNGVAETGDPAKAAPILLPIPLPRLNLAEIARRIRAEHAVLPKAKTVANDETPIDTDDKILTRSE